MGFPKADQAKTENELQSRKAASEKAKSEVDAEESNLRRRAPICGRAT